MEQWLNEQEYKLGNLSQGSELLKLVRRNTAGSVAALPMSPQLICRCRCGTWGRVCMHSDSTPSRFLPLFASLPEGFLWNSLFQLESLKTLFSLKFRSGTGTGTRTAQDSTPRGHASAKGRQQSEDKHPQPLHFLMGKHKAVFHKVS